MRTEAEIRAEIEQTRNDLPDAMGSDWSYHQGRISALEWALSSPSPVAGEDEIVEAMAKAIVDAWALANDVDFSWDEMCEAAKEPARFKKISKMHDQAVLEAVAVLAVAHPLIACAARAGADAEIAELRASLAATEARGRIEGLREARQFARTYTWFAKVVDQIVSDIDARIAELTSDPVETK